MIGSGFQRREGAIRPDAETSGRALDLVGDSAELVAFALLRQVVQLEQRSPALPPQFDRASLLDAYAECLEAVHGRRKAASATLLSTDRAARDKRAKIGA